MISQLVPYLTCKDKDLNVDTRIHIKSGYHNTHLYATPSAGQHGQAEDI